MSAGKLSVLMFSRGSCDKLVSLSFKAGYPLNPWGFVCAIRNTSENRGQFQMKSYYRVSLIVVLFAAAVFTAPVNAQGPNRTDGTPVVEVNTAPGTGLFAALRWRNI